jgi:transposase
MPDQPFVGATAIRVQFGAIFVSLELSRSSWLITSLSPGNGEKISKHGVKAGDLAGLLARLEALRCKAAERTGERPPIITVQEAGLDGFWLHRALQKAGIESHVVDAASIAAPRRRRRAKTDRLDGEALLRALLAYKRGEPRVCAMVVAPSPQDEDRRRLCRERQALIRERVAHVNRIKGLLFAQGIGGYAPLRRDRRARLEMLRTGDGRVLPAHLKAQISRELDRLELVIEQIRAVEAEQEELLAAAQAEQDGAAATTPRAPAEAPHPVTMLLHLKGVGRELATVLWTEGLSRHFANRRQVAAYAGLAATPWRSGAILREQGVSKAGNPRLRTAMVELAWLWLRHQPHSALSRWFREHGARTGWRKSAIVALARKLLVALWKYARQGVVIEGAVTKAAA